MSGYYAPAQSGYGYPAPQPGYPGPGASPYQPPNPQQNMYQASPYPPQAQPDYYQQQQQQQQQQGMYPPPNSGGPPAGYPGTMPSQPAPPQYQAPPGAPGYPSPQSMPTSAPYPPIAAPHDQPPQPYDAYQDRKADPAASQSYYGAPTAVAGDGQKGAEFWMRAYPRPSVGPQPLTPEQMQMWHYHITYNPNNKQKPPTSSTASTGEAGSYYPGAAAQSGYGYSQPQQQQQQQSMYQAPPPAESGEHHEGKQGTDWMKLAGGMAAGGLALAGTKKLFGKFTGDKHRSADEH